MISCIFSFSIFIFLISQLRTVSFFVVSWFWSWLCSKCFLVSQWHGVGDIFYLVSSSVLISKRNSKDSLTLWYTTTDMGDTWTVMFLSDCLFLSGLSRARAPFLFCEVLAWIRDSCDKCGQLCRYCGKEDPCPSQQPEGRSFL